MALTEAEYRKLADLANQHSTSVAALARALVGDARIPPPKADAVAARQLGLIGASLIELLAEIRAGKQVDLEPLLQETRVTILDLRLRLLGGGLRGPK